MITTIKWNTIVNTYKGEWIALSDDEKTVVASATTLKAAKEKAKKKGLESPLMFKVPTKNTAYIG